LSINKKRWFLLVYRLMKKRKEHFYFFVVLLPQSICIWSQRSSTVPNACTWGDWNPYSDWKVTTCCNTLCFLNFVGIWIFHFLSIRFNLLFGRADSGQRVVRGRCRLCHGVKWSGQCLGLQITPISDVSDQRIGRGPFDRFAFWFIVCVYIASRDYSHQSFIHNECDELLIIRQFETWSLTHFVLLFFVLDYIRCKSPIDVVGLWSVERKSLSRLPMTLLVELDLRFCAAFLSVLSEHRLSSRTLMSFLIVSDSLSLSVLWLCISLSLNILLYIMSFSVIFVLSPFRSIYEILEEDLLSRLFFSIWMDNSASTSIRRTIL